MESKKNKSSMPNISWSLLCVRGCTRHIPYPFSFTSLSWVRQASTLPIIQMRTRIYLAEEHWFNYVWWQASVSRWEPGYGLKDLDVLWENIPGCAPCSLSIMMPHIRAFLFSYPVLYPLINSVSLYLFIEPKDTPIVPQTPWSRVNELCPRDATKLPISLTLRWNILLPSFPRAMSSPSEQYEKCP